MAALLQSLHRTLLLGLLLALLPLLLYLAWPGFSHAVLWPFLLRWLHVLSAILWLGLLYYFNFVQVPAMAAIPEEQRPAVTRHVAPRALFWFRWAAAATVVTGLMLSHASHDIAAALTFGLAGSVASFGYALLGLGMWLGLVMAFNVWFLLWPAQRKALGLVPASPPERQAAARRALLVSRINLALSFPMLIGMVGAQNLG